MGLLIKMNVVCEVVAVGLVSFGCLVGIYAFILAAATYATAKTPEQIVDAELYACTKNMIARPGEEVGGAGLKC